MHTIMHAARRCSGKQSNDLTLRDSCLLEIEIFWVNFTMTSDNTSLFINAHTAAGCVHSNFKIENILMNCFRIVQVASSIGS